MAAPRKATRDVRSNMLSSMVVCLIIVAAACAFSVHALLNRVRCGGEWKHYLAPTILFACLMAFWVYATIRMVVCAVYSKFEVVSFMLAGALGIFTMFMYGPRLVLALRGGKATDLPRVQKIAQAFIFFCGMLMLLGVLIITIFILLL